MPGRATPPAAARFQALTDAYDLLRDPGRRADYDRGHPAGNPAASRPARARGREATTARLAYRSCRPVS